MTGFEHGRVAVLLLAMVVGGCAQQTTGSVTGAVIYRGEKLTSGTVTFYSSGGIAKAAALIQ